MLHKEMLCTCFQLVLVAKLLVAPLHHIEVWQFAGITVNQLC